MRPPSQDALCFYADFGGAHRAVGEALAEDMPGRSRPRLIQLFGEFSPFLDHCAKGYGLMLRAAPWSYTALYTFGRLKPFWDGIYHAMLRPPTRRALRRLFETTDVTCVVSVCALTSRLVGDALEELRLLGRVPFAVVVVDLFDVHPMWAEPRADRTLVCTDAAARALAGHGVPSSSIRVVRFPVRRAFLDGVGDRARLRADLGMNPARPLALLMAGGDGVLDLRGIARRILRSTGDWNVCAVTGRNALQRRRLAGLQAQWGARLRVRGYADNVAELMRAADVLVTKAGPATIMEAIHVGIPLILTGYVPPQERGNVRYVLDNGIGVWMDAGGWNHFDQLAGALIHGGVHRAAVRPLEALPGRTAAQEIDELVSHRNGGPPR